MVQIVGTKRAAEETTPSSRPVKGARHDCNEIICIGDSQPEIIEVIDCDASPPNVPGKVPEFENIDDTVVLSRDEHGADVEGVSQADIIPLPVPVLSSVEPPRRASGPAASKVYVGGKVTLAKNWTAGKSTDGWIMSEKLDGMRAVWMEGGLYTRTGNLIVAPEWFTRALPSEDVVLDGELFLGRGKFQEVMSVCRSSKMDDRWKQVKFMVFDAPDANGGILERLKVAREVLERSRVPNGTYFAEVLEQEVCDGTAELMGKLEEIERAGGEGLMLRHPTAPYRAGRVSDLLKVKTFKDDEALVIGHQSGGGKHGGRLGALLCRSRTGKEFKVGTGFSDAQRENPPSVGSVITFKYFELTKAGIPRFPVYYRQRQDIDTSIFN